MFPDDEYTYLQSYLENTGADNQYINALDDLRVSASQNAGLRKLNKEYAVALLDLYVLLCPGWVTEGTPDDMLDKIKLKVKYLLSVPKVEGKNGQNAGMARA